MEIVIDEDEIQSKKNKKNMFKAPAKKYKNPAYY